MNAMKSWLVCLAAGLSLAAGSPGTDTDTKAPTAFRLAREGNRYLGEQSKDKIVQIRSEKSVGGLAPNVWFVVYYDPTTTFKAVEIKFGDGTMIEITRPARLIELGKGEADKLLDREKFKVDSDRAIQIATTYPDLSRLTLRATKLWLERGETGPVWKVKIWAAKFRKPGDDADIGDIYVSTEDGKIVKTDLHLNRLD